MRIRDEYPTADNSVVLDLEIFESEARQISTWSKTLDFASGDVPDCVEDLINTLLFHTGG